MNSLKFGELRTARVWPLHHMECEECGATVFGRDWGFSHTTTSGASVRTCKRKECVGAAVATLLEPINPTMEFYDAHIDPWRDGGAA
jgi:predicted transcriptional regulator